MRIKVLGSAAGGGFPQWNCGCPNCDRARRGLLRAALAPKHRSPFPLPLPPGFCSMLRPISGNSSSSDPDFAPAQNTRGTPIAAIILMSADVDCVMGLLHLREFQPLHIYATPSVLRALTEENSLFRSLERSVPPVKWEALPLDRDVPIFQPLAGAGGSNAVLSCRAVSLGGGYPDYVSDALRKQLAGEEAVIGLRICAERQEILLRPQPFGPRRRVEVSARKKAISRCWTAPSGRTTS